MLRITNAWNLLLRRIEIGRNSHLVTLMPPAIPNIVVNDLLPIVFYVQAGEIFDNALEWVIDNRSLRVPRKYQKTFGGRVRFFDASGLFSNPSEVARIQLQRNDAAHEHCFSIAWDDLLNDVSALHNELELFGIVGPMPDLEFFFEASAVEGSNDPSIAFQRRIKYGVHDKGQEKTVCEWTAIQRTYNSV